MRLDFYDICLKARDYSFNEGRGIITKGIFTNITFYETWSDLCGLPKITELDGDLTLIDKRLIMFFYLYLELKIQPHIFGSLRGT